jgi:PAS domain S-box-containing protein
VSKKIIKSVIAYALALVGVGVAFFLRVVIVHFTGSDLPLYITFFPFLIFAAVLGGLGPGLLATAASALIVDYFFLTPYEPFWFGSLADIVGMALFIVMGVLISVVVELYRWRQRKETDYTRSLIEASLDPFVTISSKGKITDVNEATVKIVGISRDKLIGTDFSSYFTEPEKAREGYQQVFTKGFVSGYPLTIRSNDGKQTDVLYNATVYKDDNGNVLGVFAAARDISWLEKEVRDRTQDLKNANIAAQNVLEDLHVEEEKLDNAKAEDDATLASIGNGLVTTDIKGRIVLTNKAFEEMLGWKEVEVRGKLLTKAIIMTDENGTVVPESKRPINIVLKERATTTTTTTTTTSYYKRRDGTTFPVVITTSPVLLGNKFTGVVEVFRDITKEAAVDKAKTEFVSLASHQLRTPLSVVNWYTEMLMTGDVGKLNAEQKKYLDEVYHGNQRMVTLVNALLNVSRLELGTFVIEPKPTDMSKAIKDTIDEYKKQVDDKKIKLSYSFGKNIPIIPADPKLLHMIIENILSNAVKYTPESGKIEILLSLDKQKNVLMKISDTGYGIPKNLQDKIFTKLFRADNVREKDTEGTGLGLYIVKSIIDNSDGKIWFTSEENKGTTFFVTIPIAGMKKKEGTKTLS